MTTLQKMRIAFFILLFGALFSASSHSETTITEINPHKFPDAISNPSQTARLRVTWKGELKAVRNTTVLGDLYNAGEFLLTSDSDKTFTVNMTNDADISGVTLKTFQFRYKNKTYTTFPVSGLANPGAGTTATVGMRILFTKDVPSGDIAPSYTITVTEDP